MGTFRIAGDRLTPVRRVIFASGERADGSGRLRGLKVLRCTAEALSFDIRAG